MIPFVAKHLYAVGGVAYLCHLFYLLRRYLPVLQQVLLDHFRFVPALFFKNTEAIRHNFGWVLFAQGSFLRVDFVDLVGKIIIHGNLA